MLTTRLGHCHLEKFLLCANTPEQAGVEILRARLTKVAQLVRQGRVKVEVSR